MIDEAGAAQRILPKSKQKKSIGKLEIEDIISKIARIPAQTVNADDKKLLLKLDRNLKNVVFGQDRAIDLLTGAIRQDLVLQKDKPLGSFLFSAHRRWENRGCSSTSLLDGG